MEEYLPEISSTKIISLQNVTVIMEKRTVVIKELLRKSCHLTVEKVSAETPFLDKLKNKIYASISPSKAMCQKTVFCRSYTLKEINDVESKRYLSEAFELEKQGKLKEADLHYRSYLSKVQFRFTLLSNSAIYESLKPGDTIVGAIDKYETSRGEFLTIQSSSVRYK